jgi:hypothetical protein
VTIEHAFEGCIIFGKAAGYMCTSHPTIKDEGVAVVVGREEILKVELEL